VAYKQPCWHQPDTGSSSTDGITSSANLTISGTALPGSFVAIALAGVGVIGQ
jgi:hypothetical protein